MLDYTVDGGIKGFGLTLGAEGEAGGDGGRWESTQTIFRVSGALIHFGRKILKQLSQTRSGGEVLVNMFKVPTISPLVFVNVFQTR
jgi:hypothetical protein